MNPASATAIRSWGRVEPTGFSFDPRRPAARTPTVTPAPRPQPAPHSNPRDARPAPTRGAASLILIIAAATIALLFFAGCAQVKQAHAPNPRIPPPVAPLPLAEAAWQPAPPSDGSLWSQSAVGLFGDVKAARRGDIVLVHVNQRSSGTKRANTDTSRQAGIGARIKYFLGLEDDINRLNGYTEESGVTPGTGDWNPVNLVDASSESTFKGKGETQRTDMLLATISTIVTDVLQNGNLVIYGSEIVMLNNEASVLTVQGVVRPTDISYDNTISSERIANARIEFTGDGVITDKQHPGWAMRVFDWAWPF